MYFDMKNILKNNCNHTSKQAYVLLVPVCFFIFKKIEKINFYFIFYFRLFFYIFKLF